MTTELEHLVAVREDLLDKLTSVLEEQAQSWGEGYRSCTKEVDWIYISDGTTVHEILFELGKKGWPTWEVKTTASEDGLTLSWHQPYTEEEVEQEITDYRRRAKGISFGPIGEARKAIRDVEELIINCVLR